MNLRLCVIIVLLCLAAMVTYFSVAAYAQNTGSTNVGAGDETMELPAQAPEQANTPLGVAEGAAGPQATTATPLTIGECQGLDGDVIPNHTCETGIACSTEGPDGRLRQMCIDELEQEQTGSATTPGANTPTPGGVVGEQATVATPLTKAECQQLGGQVNFDFWNRCRRSLWVCRRQNAEGRWASVCINDPE
jgi:hypothetical protein